MHDSSDMMDGIKSRTGCNIELLDSDDPRAALCPRSQRLLRVAGGRDQVGLGEKNWFFEKGGWSRVDFIRKEMCGRGCYSHALKNKHIEFARESLLWSIEV